MSPLIATVADPERYDAHQDTTIHFFVMEFNKITTAKNSVIVFLYN
jgi:hypothetical protein